MNYSFRQASETQKRQSLHRRMMVVHAFLLVIVLTIAARLIELQLVRGSEYHEAAQSQHFGEIDFPAKRGEILGVNSRTGETSIFATNSTQDLVYVDPVVANPSDRPSDAKTVAVTLADILLTQEFHTACSRGEDACPRELMHLYAAAFDPVEHMKIRQSALLQEPLPPDEPIPPQLLKLPNFVQARDQFAAQIEKKISQTRVTYAPLKYGATKKQMSDTEALGIPGVRIVKEDGLVYANPQEINQSLLDSFSRKLADVLHEDEASIRGLLRSRPLRYVPVMRRLPRSLSIAILAAKTESAKQALEAVRAASKSADAFDPQFPLRSVALIAEHWRLYPDTTVASQVIGFLNTNRQPQYGVERTFNVQLRGQEGRISAVSDPQGGQIVRAEQSIVDARDGDTVVLTIDRAVQKEVETIMQRALERFRADSAQAIVMEPLTGRIIAMVNAPLFDGNTYADVSEKEPIRISADGRKKIEVEIFHPQTNARVARHYMDTVLTASGRTLLPEKTQQALKEIEQLYDLRDHARYYVYISEYLKREVFPTEDPDVWLKFRNNIGLGAYLNQNIQGIYEPGSVLKAITMAIAIDQGEVTPSSTYDDVGPVTVPEDPLRPINNNDFQHYGRVTMTNCLEFSINTCMTDIAFRLGSKLFHGSLERFGFSRITGVELEDELAGDMLSWRGMPRRTLATMAFGQGISATPLQVVTAMAALANGGKLMRPTILDRIEHADGTVEKIEPHMVDQIITPQTSETVTAMLVSSASKGFAKAGKPQGYRVAGKTGTSEIAAGGRYETGTGSTIASYAGYAPVNQPRFVVLVKIDRPKNSVHGATAAAPTFKEIVTFLFKYYGIPPDER